MHYIKGLMVFPHIGSEWQSDCLVQNCSISSANALEIQQSCNKPSNHKGAQLPQCQWSNPEWYGCKGLISNHSNSQQSASLVLIDPSHKSHHASHRYPIMHHFVTEMCLHVHISVTKCCIVGYGTDAFWDLWHGSIPWDELYTVGCLYNMLNFL